MSAAEADKTQSYGWLRIGEIALAALCYFALARASLMLASINASVTPVWPPTGLAIALMLLRGNAMLPAIFMGAFAANFITTPSVLTAGLIGIGNTLEAFIASQLLRIWAQGERVFYSPAGIVKFAAIVIAAAAPASASVGALALAATGFAAWSDLPQIWVTWWLGDLAGAILATPALLLWGRTWRGQETRDVSPQTPLTFLTAVLVGLLAFSPLSPAPPAVRNALAFLVILPLLWAALRLGLRDTATTALLISCLAVWGVVAGSSPFNQTTLNESLLLLIAFIVAATLPSLALAAERRETQSALTQTRQELVQSQKLEALGQLTGGVAHDFNNLLAAISGGLRTLRRQEEERAKTLEAIVQTLDRGAALTKQLLAFARREPLQPEIVNMKDVMEGVETLIAQSLNQSVTVDIRVAPGIWPVKVERSQLELALLNLAINARDAMPDGGALSIEVENVASDRHQGVCITVRDNGPGMNADVLARAFEPFFSTKPAGVGTGLGLAQVYGFAKQSGGDATIESTPGHGVSVLINLPRA